MKKYIGPIFLPIFIFLVSCNVWAWHDETHLAIAKAAGHEMWYNAVGADMAKLKAGNVEKKNHYVNNKPGTIVTPKMVLWQVSRYNKSSALKGHLYGAILGAVREYRSTTLQGKYGFTTSCPYRA